MSKNGLIYDVNQKPPFGKNLIFAIQQFLAIIAATILVPVLVNAESGTSYLSQSAALLGAGVGTIIYLLFTKFKSPVFLGSSFAFIMPLATAAAFGYLGIFLGAIFAGLVYCLLALIVKVAGVDWITKLMPPVVIGPTVALIGLSLSGSAMNNIMNTAGDFQTIVNGSITTISNYNLVSILIGIVTFLVTIIVSVKGKKGLKLFPFVIGVLAGYALAVILTLIGQATNVTYLQLVSFEPFTKILNINEWLPDMTFLGIFSEGASKLDGFAGVLSVFIAFAPVALVVFAEHIADHKNISSIIGKDLLKEPGLHRTLLGDGVGTMVGSFFGGCPNTTYGESVGCVALTGNASVSTTILTAILCIVISFFRPVLSLVESISSCSAIVGGICIALYGFIAVSGLRMFKHVDLDNSKNLFVVASILVTGIGGLVLKFGKVEITSIACALILGIVVNLILKPGKAEVKKEVEYKKQTEETMFGTVEKKED